MSYNNLVFLDIDGVLNSTKYYFGEENKPKGRRGAIDPSSCAIMNRLTDRPGVTVVLSSSWRQAGFNATVRQLQSRGLQGNFIGSTPHLSSAKRCDEIREWLVQADKMGYRWQTCIVIDDDEGANLFGGNFSTYSLFLNTNHVVGITDDLIDEALGFIK